MLEETSNLVHSLAPRERECLLWIARGKTYQETSMITGIAYGTIKSNLDAVRYKLNCVSMPQTTAMAVALGLFTLDDLRGR